MSVHAIHFAPSILQRCAASRVSITYNIFRTKLLGMKKVLAGGEYHVETQSVFEYNNIMNKFATA
jgi:hypothetical protein